MDNPTPTFKDLYYFDFNIKSAVQMIIGSLLFQVVAYIGFEIFYRLRVCYVWCVHSRPVGSDFYGLQEEVEA